jgi:RHS repeat-associated protein
VSSFGYGFKAGWSIRRWTQRQSFHRVEPMSAWMIEQERASQHLSEVGLYDTTGARAGSVEIPRMRDPKGDMSGSEGVNCSRNRVYSAELGRFLQTDPIRFSAGDGNLYRYVGNNPINLIDPFGLLDSSGAFNHYTGGTGTSLRMSFGDIDTSSVKPSQFPKVAKEISGSARDATISIDDRKAFSTSGDQALFLGDITLRLQGTLTLKKSDCSWKFDGTLKSFDDWYDFNKSTHRGPVGEFLTGIGRGTTGTPYWIEIRGSKQISESGKMGSGSSGGGGRGWY